MENPLSSYRDYWSFGNDTRHPSAAGRGQSSLCPAAEGTVPQTVQATQRSDTHLDCNPFPSS